jgi:hypothetical protein
MVILARFMIFPRPACPSRSRSQNGVVMPVQPGPWPEVPEGTARVARRAFRKGSLAIRVRDELGAWCEDADFAAGYGVRGRLDWKYCPGLELEDEGFDFGVLSEFRTRMVAGSLELAPAAHRLKTQVRTSGRVLEPTG